MSFGVGTQAQQVRVNGATLRNEGPDTLYYRATMPVASGTNDGSLTAGSSTTLDGNQYVVSAGRSAVNLLTTGADPAITHSAFRFQTQAGRESFALCGSAVTNLGPGTVYYRDRSGVSSTTNDGSLAVGASATLLGEQVFTSDSRAVVYVAPAIGTAGLTNLQGLAPASSQPIPLSGLGTAGPIAINYRLRYPVPESYAQMSMTLANWYVSFDGTNTAETVGTNDITVSASFEKADGTVVPLVSSLVLHAGDTVTPAPVTVNYSGADGHLFVRFYVLLPSITSQWPIGGSGNATSQSYTTAPVDQSGNSGALASPSASVNSYTPISLIGTPNHPKVVVGVGGDSIMSGSDDDFVPHGWWQRAFGDGPTYFSDSFTGVVSTNLSAHTPDDFGGTWLLVNGTSGTNDLKLTGTGALFRSGTFAMYLTPTIPVLDYETIDDFFVASVLTTDSVWVRARATDQNNYYGFNISRDGSWNLLKVVAGATTVFISGGAGSLPAWVAGETHQLKLRVQGTQVTGYYDGVQVATQSDATFSAAGKAGLQQGSGSGSAQTASTGAQTTNFAVRDLTLPVARSALRVSRSSETVALFNANSTKRMAMVAGATHAIVTGGINDVTTGATLAALQAAYTTLVNTLKGQGMYVLACTVLPNTGLTAPQATIRGQFNDWLLAGGSGANEVFDMAAAVEASHNSNTWQAGFTSGTIHPSPAGHSAITAAFLSSVTSVTS